MFFAALADVVFGNPSSPERAELISRLAPGAPALQRLGADDQRLLEPPPCS